MYGCILLLCIICFQRNSASPGDSDKTYRQCVKHCSKDCNYTSIQFRSWESFGWSCKDNCQYNCMHQRVKEKGMVEKYHGKWPFRRVGPFQELASVVFSTCNLFYNLFGIASFRARVNKKAPFYRYHHFQSVIMSASWICSILYHTKETPFTEKMDYSMAFAYIALQMSFFIVRMTWLKSRWLCCFMSIVLLGLYLNHAAQLCSGHILYGFNMMLSVGYVIIWAIGWHIWQTTPQAILPILEVDYSILIGMLEIFDFPPFMGLLDSHALWHLTSGPMILLQYSFYINDSCILHMRRKKPMSNALYC
ncbi:post-GPI attachment to proteins factor 3-like isoform X2 [Convolutriloba macropyga]|uniref:post-GPI attachment to proteins factor 3-like isoform X2 n=1 Tax=Convolutriloba macropyga TaxID=536237 RepID=UPI003F51AECE